MTGFAIDVSHHQNPSRLPWDKFAGKVDAVIVRACYGSGLRDRHAREHIRRARAIGAKVGLYMFFRPIHLAGDQFDLFRSVADECLIGPGDIVPTIDIEHDPVPKPGQNVSPAWLGKIEPLVASLDEHFGAKTMVYITQREFGMLGKPLWMLDEDRPLWVAHYTTREYPATPGNRRATMWQHRVGPFDPQGPGGYVKERPELDQNRILAPLPLLGPQPAVATVAVRPANNLGEDWDDLEERRIRELTLTGEELDALDGLIETVPDTERDGGLRS